MKINIVGNGIFGQFLKKLFEAHVSFDQSAEIVILAVPFDAYEQAASQYAGQHLVNVCSIQHDSNTICLRHSKNVTGIHPLFGPRSKELNRVAILTQTCPETESILKLFHKVDVEICDCLPDGRYIDGELHDKMMAITHLAGVRIAEDIQKIVNQAAWVPDKFIPPSFQKIRDFAVQCQDFSPGTASSIKSNRFSDI